MTKQAGIWIDHREAYIVFAGAGAQEAQHLASGMEKHVRYAGRAASEEGSADDQRDRQYATHLAQYYDEVITHLRDVTSLLLLGPGEAKGELKKRIEAKSPQIRIIGVETTDKMTQTQIAAKVHDYFSKKSRGLV